MTLSRPHYKWESIQVVYVLANPNPLDSSSFFRTWLSLLSLSSSPWQWSTFLIASIGVGFFNVAAWPEEHDLGSRICDLSPLGSLWRPLIFQADFYMPLSMTHLNLIMSRKAREDLFCLFTNWKRLPDNKHTLKRDAGWNSQNVITEFEKDLQSFFDHFSCLRSSFIFPAHGDSE